MLLKPDETYRRFSEQAKRLPTRPHVATVWRWALKGVRGVFLESYLIGGVRHCSDEALERFFEEVNERAELRREKTPLPPRKRKRSARERRESIAKAHAILRQAGVLRDAPDDRADS